MTIQLYKGDCLDIMPTIPDKSIDMILCDPPYPDYYTKEFFYFDGIIDIWDKITGAANQYDFIYERNGHKKQKVFRGHRINSTVSASFAKEKFFNHKSQKPLAVLESIINYAKIDGVICDPFMGSGSTGVACINTNRNFIGIEKEENYFKIAKKRIRETQKIYQETNNGI